MVMGSHDSNATVLPNERKKGKKSQQAETLKNIFKRLYILEQAMAAIGANQIGKKSRRFPPKRASALFSHMTKAICIETADPWKENRVRFYHPLIHHPRTPILALPFASPISPFGGFDDCGVNWVPPAGSTIVLMYEMADRDAPHYLGTCWHHNRGPGGEYLEFPSREYQSVYSGHRHGYYVGPDDESQVYAPWNTESYNGDMVYNVNTDFYTNVSEQARSTFPNIYGFKTPEKHMLKMVDGDPKCNRRWKRMELMSGCGNWMIFKDDHLHYGGQWAQGSPRVDWCAKHDWVHTGTNWPPHPKDTKLSFEGPYFTDIMGKPVEGLSLCEPNCAGNSPKQCASILDQSNCRQQDATSVRKETNADGEEWLRIYRSHQLDCNYTSGHTPTPNFPPSFNGAAATKYHNTQKGRNPWFKHKNEQRPYKGPGTLQNNKCDLPQSGIQLLSISGHTIVMDDSVEEPKGIPQWERSMQDFDYGCNDVYNGVFYVKSAHGHSFAMSDVECASKIRGKHNYIELKTATGNRLHMNDHTEPCPQNNKECPEPSKFHGGNFRGCLLHSTSQHFLWLNDNMNEQVSPCRKEGGEPQNKASKAFVLLQSGYGHKLLFCDHPETQRLTNDQYVVLENPQCSKNGPAVDPQCNTEKGKHFLHLQAKPKGEPGIVFLRAGGHAIRQTVDMDIVLVGQEDNPSDKFTWVSKDFTTATENVHFRYAGDRHLFFAENKIVLMAGRDCPPTDGQCPGPCIYSVIVSRCPVICPITNILHWTEKAMSERVFASAYHPCQVPCGGGCSSYWAAMAGADMSKCNEQQTMELSFGPPVEVQMPPNSTNIDPGGNLEVGTGFGGF